MKKVIFILLAVVTMTTVANAQSFQNGTTTVNAGIGLGTGLNGLGKARPAISVSLDHGMWDIGGPGVISLGGYVGNTGFKYTNAGYTAKWNYVIIGVRGAYHYNGFDIPELDVYGGAMLGYNIVNYSVDGVDNGFNNNYGSGLGLTGFVGGRWFFNENVGVYAELGYGVSVLSAGVTFKL